MHCGLGVCYAVNKSLVKGEEVWAGLKNMSKDQIYLDSLRAIKEWSLNQKKKSNARFVLRLCRMLDVMSEYYVDQFKGKKMKE